MITASYHRQKERYKFPNFSEFILRVNMKADLDNAKYQKTFQSDLLLLIGDCKIQQRGLGVHSVSLKLFRDLLFVFSKVMLRIILLARPLT